MMMCHLSPLLTEKEQRAKSSSVEEVIDNSQTEKSTSLKGPGSFCTFIFMSSLYYSLITRTHLFIYFSFLLLNIQADEYCMFILSLMYSYTQNHPHPSYPSRV